MACDSLKPRNRTMGSTHSRASSSTQAMTCATASIDASPEPLTSTFAPAWPLFGSIALSWFWPSNERLSTSSLSPAARTPRSCPMNAPTSPAKEPTTLATSPATTECAFPATGYRRSSVAPGAIPALTAALRVRMYRVAAAAVAASKPTGANPRDRSAAHASTSPSYAASRTVGSFAHSHAVLASKPTSSQACEHSARDVVVASTQGRARDRRSWMIKKPTKLVSLTPTRRRKNSSPSGATLLPAWSSFTPPLAPPPPSLPLPPPPPPPLLRVKFRSALS
mmetsp:Transcript_25091/g.62782  ORF Transcript_25091/g.62782 Transcript_25091/m.62782 type:complete len:280 (+) Transcript_25091:473-1312(+)